MATILKTRDLRKISAQNLHKNGIISYVLFLFAVLLACGFIALNLLVSSFFILTIPFVVLPLMFAAQAATRLMRDTSTLTLKGFFRCFFGYFSEHFRSSFRTIRSALFSLIFYGGVLLTSFTVALPCFYAFNYLNFKEFVDTLPTLLNQTSSIDAFLDDYIKVFNMISVCTTFPALTAFAFVFVYLADRNSVSIFYRLDNVKNNGRYLALINDLVIKNNRKQFNKAYWALNWPFYLLFILGFAGGAYLGYLYSFDSSSLFTFGLIGAIFVSFVIYGPSLMANKEAIYKSLNNEYINEDALAKVRLANQLNDFLNQYANKDGTKKDSDES